MTSETYRRISAPFRGRPSALRLLRLCNKAVPLICYVLYPALLLWALWARDPRFLRLLLVPAVSFFLLSLFRRWRNSPRPYEVLDIDPLIPRNKKGESFPSRHVFSVSVIAMTWLWVCPPVGAALWVLAAVLAWARVTAGIHFPRDVLAGAAVGLAAGLLGYWAL